MAGIFLPDVKALLNGKNPQAFFLPEKKKVRVKLRSPKVRANSLVKP